MLSRNDERILNEAAVALGKLALNLVVESASGSAERRSESRQRDASEKRKRKGPAGVHAAQRRNGFWSRSTKVKRPSRERTLRRVYGRHWTSDLHTRTGLCSRSLREPPTWSTLASLASFLDDAPFAYIATSIGILHASWTNFVLDRCRFTVRLTELINTFNTRWIRVSKRRQLLSDEGDTYIDIFFLYFSRI